jgi:hypothetical protein
MAEQVALALINGKISQIPASDTIRGAGSGSGSGTLLNPFTGLNFKKIAVSKYYLIKEDLENIVTRTQIIDGVLTIDGVNTIL